MDIDKIVIVTQPTWLDGLVEKFNTRQQARFYIEHTGGSFDEYESQHATYYTGLKQLKKQLPGSVRYQVVDKGFLPSFLFGPQDLVIVFGRDGLVINTAKYLDNQPILGVNPNPDLNIGILLPFAVDDVSDVIDRILNDKQSVSEITMIKAETNAGQVLYAVNDIFIGHRSHQSARYSISIDGQTERHSSSGVIISSGMGSTGWYKSIMLSAQAISTQLGVLDPDDVLSEDALRFAWDANYLRFCVREPWPSTTTGNDIIYGSIFVGSELVVKSYMPSDGTIFGDGIEQDSIQFNSGTSVTISVAQKVLFLYIK